MAGIAARLRVSSDRSRLAQMRPQELRSRRSYSAATVGRDRRPHCCRRRLSGNRPPSARSRSSPRRHLRDQWGLGCALHVGETPRSDGDSAKILAFAREKPRRVRFGHALAFSDDELRGCASLIEACPSSNAATLDLGRLEDHPRLWCRFHSTRGARRSPSAGASYGRVRLFAGRRVIKVLGRVRPRRLGKVVDDPAGAAFDASCAKANARRRKHVARGRRCVLARSPRASMAPSSRLIAVAPLSGPRTKTRSRPWPRSRRTPRRPAMAPMTKHTGLSGICAAKAWGV